MSEHTFNGFSQAGIQFLTDLKTNNNREWFNENKHIFVDEIQRPAQAFVAELGERLATIYPSIRYDTKLTGSGSIMRIYRDTRFSKDKTPYKTNLGIVFWDGPFKKMENPGFYFHLNAEEAWIGGGFYMFSKPFMEAYREAVVDDALGAQLEDAIAEMAAHGYGFHGDKYKRVPRGYDKEHPRANRLLHKGIFTNSPQLSWDVVGSAELIDTCFRHCAQIAPLQNWLVNVHKQLRD